MLFPGGRLPLRIFEQRYMDMAKACLRDGSPFGVCALRAGAEVLDRAGAPATPYEVGTLARIDKWDMPQLGLLEIVVLAGERFRIVERRVEASGLQRARIALLGPERDGPLGESGATCARLLERLVAQHPGLLPEPHRLESSAWVGARLAELLPLPLGERQALLELDDPLERLDRLSRLLRSAARP